MTKWKSLVGKFTSEEADVINQFQKMLGMNKNKFVRFSIFSTVFVYGTWIQLAESDEMKKFNRQYANLKKKASKNYQLYKIQSDIEKMADSFETAMERIVKENEPKMKKFTEKRQTGRPKSLKRKRGKPKDTGI